jgi:ASCH domain
MKALSIHQPWAWAILRAGKTVENRTWPTNYRGPLLIHASKTRSSFDREALIDWVKVYGVALPPWELMPTGGLIGIVDLVDCLPVNQTVLSPWVEGPVCWVLANPRPFPETVALRGMQGLFDVQDEMIPAKFN